MLGVDDQTQNLGVLPCAIAWLFKVVNEQKESSGSRFSVRVSAVEVTGKQEMLKDLLADVAQGEGSMCLYWGRGSGGEGGGEVGLEGGGVLDRILFNVLNIGRH